MEFIDLFCGIGGFRYSLDSIGGKCVFSSDIDQYARKTYEANFGDVPHGDITKIAASDIPDHDLLCAGFPCQAFSQAGHSKGFEDTRGTLFYEVARILSEKRPKAIFLENVKGLVSHSKGKTLATIMEILKDIGYHAEYKVLNARYFGVPQNRERIYIVGFLDKESMDKFQWPEHSGKNVVLADILEDNIGVEYYISQTYLNWLTRHRNGHQAKGNNYGYVVIAPDECSNALMVGGMGHERNLVAGHIMTENELGLRKMTVKEWARLQGFPDTFKFPVSKTQAYRQLGNSVAIPVIIEIAKKIAGAL